MRISRFSVSRISLPAVLLSVLAVRGAVAQTTTWTAPASGYVYDTASRGIRPILGYPGSAILGPAIVADADWAAVAPNQKSALVTQGSSILWVADLASPSQTAALQRLPSPRQSLWAADSGRAVVLTANQELYWLNTGAPVPGVQSFWRLSAFHRTVRGAQPVWTLLASDPAGDQVLLSVTDGETWQLWSASKQSPPFRVPFSGQPAAAVFASHSSAVYVVDAASHQILRTDDALRGAPVFRSLVASADLIEDPVGLALSADDNRLHLVDRRIPSLRVFSAADGSPLGELPLDEAPGSVSLFAAGRYILNPAVPGAQSLYYLDTGAPPSVVFVPRGE